MMGGDCHPGRSKESVCRIAAICDRHSWRSGHDLRSCCCSSLCVYSRRSPPRKASIPPPCKPATDTWPTYNGDYSGRRFSTLDQINSTNIASLTLAWAFPVHIAPVKSTPLEVGGILYFTTP